MKIVQKQLPEPVIAMVDVSAEGRDSMAKVKKPGEFTMDRDLVQVSHFQLSSA